MSYDLKDDMLECFCGNSKYRHFYYPKEKKIIYYPFDTTVTNQYKRCKFFHCKHVCILDSCFPQTIYTSSMPKLKTKPQPINGKPQHQPPSRKRDPKIG